MQFSAIFLLTLSASTIAMPSPVNSQLSIQEKRQASLTPNPDALPAVNTHAGECKSEGSPVNFYGVSVTLTPDITTGKTYKS